jgi:putative iron-dependent peroxidase
MFGITEDGLYDKIIEYSKPLTSSYWFAPSTEDLEDLLK